MRIVEDLAKFVQPRQGCLLMRDPPIRAGITIRLCSDRSLKQDSSFVPMPPDVGFSHDIALYAHLFVAVDAVTVQLTRQHSEVMDAVAELGGMRSGHLQPCEFVAWEHGGTDRCQRPKRSVGVANRLADKR